MVRGWLTALPAVLLVVLPLLSACPGDRDATGGPYVDIDPGEEIDLGEVAKGTEVPLEPVP